VRERIEYRFRVPSAAIFTLYSYSKVLEYPLEYPTAGSLIIISGLHLTTAYELAARLKAGSIEDFIIIINPFLQLLVL
jgi:prepilin signal peptidase PulO-like enzyme (type II secretory pathway)